MAEAATPAARYTDRAGSRRLKRVSCELDLMGLDQPRYVVVNGWPEGSHLNEVMATRGGVCVGHFYT